MLDLIRAGGYASAAERFVEDVALGPGAWARLPEQMRAAMAANAPTFLDEELAPDSRTIDAVALASYAGPILLTSGDQSPPILKRMVEELSRLLPQAHRVNYAGAGHMPHLTHPQEYVSTVLAFVSAHSPDHDDDGAALRVEQLRRTALGG